MENRIMRDSDGIILPTITQSNYISNTQKSIQQTPFDAPSIASKAQIPSLVCSRCHNAVAYEWIYCEYCGKQLQSLSSIKIPPLSSDSSLSSTSLLLHRNSSAPASPSTQLPSIEQIHSNYFPVQQSRKNKSKKSSQEFKSKVEEKKKKLKELEDKRYSKLLNVVQKYEEHNQNITRYYQQMIEKSSGERRLKKKTSAMISSSYLDEQPSIIDRVNDGFTAEEDAERVLFWGKQVQEETPPSKSMYTFSSVFWGKPEEQSPDDDEENIQHEPDEVTHENSALNVQWNLTPDIIPEDKSSVKETELSISLEPIRRNITRNLLHVIHFMEWILHKTDFDLVIDPISFPNSLKLYTQSSVRLTVAIHRAYEMEIQNRELSQQYLHIADQLRHQIAFEIVEIQQEADRIHSKCHDLYEAITSGVFLQQDGQPDYDHLKLTDPVLIQRNQHKVLEYSKSILDPVRVHINHLIAKETQIISYIKNDEMALRTAQEQYQQPTIDLILRCKTTLARITSVRRWIAIRIIQRFVRSLLYEMEEEEEEGGEWEEE